MLTISEINPFKNVEIEDPRLANLASELIRRVSPFLTTYTGRIIFRTVDDEDGYFSFVNNPSDNEVTINFTSKFWQSIIGQNGLEGKSDSLISIRLLEIFDQDLLQLWSESLEHELRHAQMDDVIGDKSESLTKSEFKELESMLSIERVENLLISLGFRREHGDLLYPFNYVGSWSQLTRINHQLIYLCSLQIADPSLRRKYLYYCYTAGLQEQYLGILTQLSKLQSEGKLVIESYGVNQYYLLPYSNVGFENIVFSSDKTNVLRQAHQILHEMNPESFESFLDSIMQESSNWDKSLFSSPLKNW